MSGFFARFRKQPDAAGPGQSPAPDGGNPLLSHEAAHTVQDQSASPPPDGDQGADKLSGPDLDAEGNDVAVESLELSHVGFEPGDAGDASGPKLAQYALDGNSPAPDGAVDVKYTMFQADGTAVNVEGDPVHRYTLTDAWPQKDEPEPTQDLAQDDDGSSAGWPVKWYMPELDGSQAGAPSLDPDEMTTLVRLTESSEMIGVAGHLAPDDGSGLFDADDDEPDPNDLT